MTSGAIQILRDTKSHFRSPPSPYVTFLRKQYDFRTFKRPENLAKMSLHTLANPPPYDIWWLYLFHLLTSCKKVLMGN